MPPQYYWEADAPVNSASSAAVNSAPSAAQVIRAALAVTGAYVASEVMVALGRAKVHFDFIFSGTPTNSGCIVAYLQVSENSIDWRDIMGVVADTAATTDPLTTVVSATQAVRQLNTEYNCLKVDYPQATLTRTRRITLDLGYGGFYRLQVRAANAAGVSTAAAAGTLPTLAINATLQ